MNFPVHNEAEAQLSTVSTPDLTSPGGRCARGALDVIDPDLGVNVVDLGLVRGISVEHGYASGSMTLTSAACPLSSIVEKQVKPPCRQFQG